MKIGVIPARLHSTRLPEKILLPIAGVPMIVRVYQQAVRAKLLNKVIVAIDDKKTETVLNRYGISGIMTGKHHLSGTDRAAEAVRNEDAKIIVNIQGDEPEIEPELIDKIVDLCEEKNTEIATAASTDLRSDEILDRDVVKVKINKKNFATSFFRRPVSEKELFRHIGIYGFKKNTLDTFTSLPPSENEVKQKLEQHRALDNGINIRILVTDYRGHGVDTMMDLKRMERKYAS